jgi:hypothetical protein
MPLAIGHHPLVTWVMFIIAGCLFASGIAVGFARCEGEAGQGQRDRENQTLRNLLQKSEITTMLGECRT